MHKHIFMTCPAFGRNGGIRVILEWANRLSTQHTVHLRVQSGETGCGWFPISKAVHIERNDAALPHCDLAIITSPHGHNYLNPGAPAAKRTVVFLQMMEHLFHPSDRRWFRNCSKLYQTRHPLITISAWGALELQKFGRTAPTHIIGNGVNLCHFPINETPKDYKTVLVEGWMVSNATKDTERVGPQVAAKLKAQGCQIIAFGATPIAGNWNEVPNEYYCSPDISILNELYARGTILLKATKQDFRSCAPMEAMTKGTVTARAIAQGDDDLVHLENCLRGPYEAKSLFANALRLMQDKTLHAQLSERCRAHVQEFSWDYWMQRVEKVLWKD